MQRQAVTPVLVVQGRSMPARAAHAASFQGHSLRLEVQCQGHHAKLPLGVRVRVVTFSNAYVGQLRLAVAHQLGLPASNVRLLHGGASHNLFTLHAPMHQTTRAGFSVERSRAGCMLALERFSHRTRGMMQQVGHWCVSRPLDLDLYAIAGGACSA